MALGVGTWLPVDEPVELVVAAWLRDRVCDCEPDSLEVRDCVMVVVELRVAAPDPLVD